MKLRPTTEVTSATAGSSFTIASACRITLAVRSTDAPPGNCTMTKKAPWSSSGRNPVGVMRASPTVPSAATPTSTRPMTEKRTIRATARAIGVAHVIDRAHDLADDAATRTVMRPEEHAAQRGRQRERVDRGDEHRHRDGHRELAEQLAGNAGNERDRHEHREQHQRDRDDRRGDLAHGELGRVCGRKFGMLLHHALDVLDDDDGVVDHDADREHDGEQRHRVRRIADRIEHDEGADQAHRHGEGRDQGGADAAEKQIDDDDDEDERLDQRLLHLLDGVLDEGRGVVGHLPGEILRKPLLQLGRACPSPPGAW